MKGMRKPEPKSKRKLLLSIVTSLGFVSIWLCIFIASIIVTLLGFLCIVLYASSQGVDLAYLAQPYPFIPIVFGIMFGSFAVSWKLTMVLVGMFEAVYKEYKKNKERKKDENKRPE